APSSAAASSPAPAVTGSSPAYSGTSSAAPAESSAAPAESPAAPAESPVSAPAAAPSPSATRTTPTRADFAGRVGGGGGPVAVSAPTLDVATMTARIGNVVLHAIPVSGVTGTGF